MSIKFIATVTFGLFLILFALFNQQAVKVILMGFHLKAESLAIVVFWSFIAGVIYATILAISNGMKLRGTIKKLKEEIHEFNEKDTE